MRIRRKKPSCLSLFKFSFCDGSHANGVVVKAGLGQKVLCTGTLGQHLLN